LVSFCFPAWVGFAVLGFVRVPTAVVEPVGEGLEKFFSSPLRIPVLFSPLFFLFGLTFLFFTPNDSLPLPWTSSCPAGPSFAPLSRPSFLFLFLFRPVTVPVRLILASVAVRPVFSLRVLLFLGIFPRCSGLFFCWVVSLILGFLFYLRFYFCRYLDEIGFVPFPSFAVVPPNNMLFSPSGLRFFPLWGGFEGRCSHFSFLFTRHAVRDVLLLPSFFSRVIPRWLC